MACLPYTIPRTWKFTKPIMSLIKLRSIVLFYHPKEQIITSHRATTQVDLQSATWSDPKILHPNKPYLQLKQGRSFEDKRSLSIDCTDSEGDFISYRLLTSNFLHDSFVHLAVSSYALFTIAPEAESILGILAFMTTYILGGVAGSGLCFLLTDAVTVGASTGIFGLIGDYSYTHSIT